MQEKEVAPRRPRGRPPRQIEHRPTACPDGHRGRLVLWGRRTHTSAPFRRPRIKGLPSDGSPAHTFSLARRQAAASHPHGEECPTCDVRPGLALGPVARTDHYHTANEIARRLQLAGRGTSLRRASRTVRLESQHFVEDHHGMRRASRAFALAARYLDLCAPRIDERLAPTRWPRILILDSTPLNIRAYDAELHVPGGDPEERGGAILAATGSDDPGLPMMAWRIGVAGDETTESWLDFLSGFDPDGPGPAWVVADGAKAIAAAVCQRWPNAICYSCEFHLGRALRGAASRDGIHADHEAHAELFERAFWSEADWDRARRVHRPRDGRAPRRLVARQRRPRARAGPAARGPLRLPSQQRGDRAPARLDRRTPPAHAPVPAAQRAPATTGRARSVRSAR